MTIATIYTYIDEAGGFYPDDLRDDEALERKQEAQAIADRLCSLYEQGVPFFSKSTFRYLLRQLDHCRTNPCPANKNHWDSDQDGTGIAIPAIDGTVVETELKTGLVMPGDKRNTEFVLMDPYLRYRAFQHLHHDILTASVSSEWSYCPTRLVYPMKRRRIRTGKFLDSFKHEDPEVVQEALEEGIKQWEGSRNCRHLRDLFDAIMPPKVNKIVAFACSTMTAKSLQPRTVYQHCLLLTILDILRSRRSEEQPEIRCFAQDPFYTDTDEEVLGKAGVTVVQDPRGFSEVDDQSVVVSFAPDAPIRQIVADIARPAVMIWDRVKGEVEDAERYSDPESPRLWDMIQNHYDEAAKLGPEERFGDAAVYIRRK
ncbi:hypothetical protein VTK56DRAFT_5207 [Thermocarpiscus australiensis]